MNVGSRKQHCTIVQKLQFSNAKEVEEIRWGHPNGGAKYRRVKIGDFTQISYCTQISRYISETVHIIDIVTMEG